MCGPCNCDTTRGFHKDCNKTSGECRCKVKTVLASANVQPFGLIVKMSVNSMINKKKTARFNETRLLSCIC